jgi:hypothetical protein
MINQQRGDDTGLQPEIIGNIRRPGPGFRESRFLLIHTKRGAR